MLTPDAIKYQIETCPVTHPLAPYVLGIFSEFTAIARINTHSVYLTFTHHTRRPLKHRHNSPPLYVKVQSPEEANARSTPTERTAKDNSPQPPPTTPTKARNVTSPSSVVTPKAVRNSLAKSPEAAGPKRNFAAPTESGQTNESHKESQNSGTANNKNATKDKGAKSPSSPRPPNSLRLKSPNKSSPGTPRKTSPKELKLPKLATSPVSQETTPSTETHSKITLPKLIESTAQSTRVAH